MKKYSLLILTLFCLIFAPTVEASTVTPVISGTKTVTVGSTTKIYIKANASDKIEGVDVTYKADGNISVTKAAVNSKFSTMGQDGTRYILYAPTPVASGSTILTLTVKGTKAGKGTITVSSMEATVAGETAVGSTKIYNITVKAKETVKEEDKVDNALKNATELVEKAEKSLSQSDYDKALQSVNALENGEAKTNLLNRLNSVKTKIDLAKEENEEIKENCEKCKDCEKCNTVIWIAISIALAVALIIETGYLIYKNENK